jgi:hypothetical protein
VARRLPGKFVLPLGLEVCLLGSYLPTVWENAIDKVIDAAILVSNEELREIVKEKRRKRGRQCRNWIARRESLGTSNCLFRELSSGDPEDYRKYVTMSVEKFDELFRLVESYISKTNTVMKAAISARLKLEVTLRFLATRDSFSSFALLFRIPSCSISRFLPETLQLIIFQENIGPLKPRKFRLINIFSSSSTSFFDLRKLLPVHVFFKYFLSSFAEPPHFQQPHSFLIVRPSVSTL